MRLPILAGLAMALILSGCQNGSTIAPPGPPPPLHGPQAWAITTGGSSQSDAMQAFDYYPNAMTIDVGDTITFTDQVPEPHTVSIPPAGATPPPGPPQPPVGGTTFDGTAYISSGFLAPNQNYTVTFTKAGTYKVYCLIHQPEMTGTIVVQPAGTSYPKDQSQYFAESSADLTLDLGDASNSVATFPYAIGGLHLAAGIAPGLAAGAPAQSTVMRFLNATTLGSQPLNATVPLGGTITWTNQSNNAPHTISFPIAGQGPPAGPPGRGGGR